jgi:heme/copper-type cytochrome/quinol oxidase subunit 2
MSEKTSYREKIKQLEGELNKAQTALNTDSFLSPTVIIAIIIPIVIGLVLYFMSPKWVMTKDEKTGKSTESYGKVALYTLIISAVLWGCLYGYTVYAK